MAMAMELPCKCQPRDILLEARICQIVLVAQLMPGTEQPREASQKYPQKLARAMRGTYPRLQVMQFLHHPPSPLAMCHMGVKVGVGWTIKGVGLRGPITGVMAESMGRSGVPCIIDFGKDCSA